jgi:hypothetical protein
MTKETVMSKMIKRRNNVKKIKSLFVRNYDTGYITDEVTPGAEWVQNGEGVATRKYDGTCCLIRGGKLYKRYKCKKGKNPPEGFEPAQDKDEVTGYWPGWIPVGEGPEDYYHREAFYTSRSKPDGTYELYGPKINKNPVLIPHGQWRIPNCPRTYNELKEWFGNWVKVGDIEGIVWHRENGDMVKIKKKDFGLKRND